MGVRSFYALQRLDNRLHRLHQRHLVPAWLIRPVCDRYEARLLASCPPEYDWTDDEDLALSHTNALFDALAARGEPVEIVNMPPASWIREWNNPGDAVYDDFYEEDEPLADVLAAWERGEKFPTAPPNAPAAPADGSEGK